MHLMLLELDGRSRLILKLGSHDLELPMDDHRELSGAVPRREGTTGVKLGTFAQAG